MIKLIFEESSNPNSSESVDKIINEKLNASCLSDVIVYYLLSLIDLNTLSVCLIAIMPAKLHIKLT